MTESSDHRIVSHEDDDGTTHIAVVARSPETDQLSDDAIITSLQEWKAAHHPDAAPGGRRRWPLPSPFNEWLMATKPGPTRTRCPECRCFSLRTCTDQDQPDQEVVVCTMAECEASPFYRGEAL